MFQITKFCKDSRDFISLLSLNGKSRSLQVSIALGRVLSNNLPLPTGPVDSIVSYYNLQYRNEIEQQVSVINEVCLLNVNTVLDYCLKFYAYRYNCANPDDVIIAVNKETALVDFFKLSSIFDNEAIKTIVENPVEMTDLVNKFNKIRDELKAQ